MRPGQQSPRKLWREQPEIRVAGSFNEAGATIAPEMSAGAGAVVVEGLLQ